MKQLAILFAVLIIIYSIYYDLTVGTIPHSETAASLAIEEQTEPDSPYTLVEIKPGDTVLSLMESIQQGPLPVSIEQAIKDFESLNGNVKPEQIRVGKSYKFPIYR